MKKILAIVALTSIAFNYTSAEVVEGILELRTNEELEATYLVINSDKPVKHTAPEGNEESKEIQVAGLDQERWNAAIDMVGQHVLADGSLMLAHTRYHHTPILIITDKLTAKEGKSNSISNELAEYTATIKGEEIQILETKNKQVTNYPGVSDDEINEIIAASFTEVPNYKIGKKTVTLDKWEGNTLKFTSQVEINGDGPLENVDLTLQQSATIGAEDIEITINKASISSRK